MEEYVSGEESKIFNAARYLEPDVDQKFLQEF